MTNQEILTKAIEKAIANGWRGTDDNAPQQWLSVLKSDQISIDAAGGEDQLFFREDWYPVIFNHNFAKALWGEGLYQARATYRGEPIGKMSWQYHLQQMVTADDPIKYLGKNI